MKNLLCLLALVFAFAKSEAQFRVIFKLLSAPPSHRNEPVFIAGNFNSWNPGNTWYMFNNSNQLSLQLDAGEYEYKCTRGSWDKVEIKAGGKDIENRVLKIQSDTTVEITVEAWRDDMAAPEKKHTANSRVQVIDTAFRIPQLNRTRRIWVYLPEGYETGNKRYPVLYMHDGQNLFDEYTADSGEWQVDESMDSLVAKGRQACIVVGIDNAGEARMNEYNLFNLVLTEFKDGSKTFSPEGKEYIDFLAHTLKPFIDKKYRTLPARENTVIAGSSMGALISYYAMLLEPGVFGKAGIFSPSFWTNPSLASFTDSLAGKMSGKFFFYAGAKESASMVSDMQAVQEELGEGSSCMIYSVVDPEGSHNSKSWKKWFAEFYAWIMADGFNYVVRTRE